MGCFSGTLPAKAPGGRCGAGGLGARSAGTKGKGFAEGPRPSPKFRDCSWKDERTASQCWNSHKNAWGASFLLATVAKNAVPPSLRIVCALGGANPALLRLNQLLLPRPIPWWDPTSRPRLCAGQRLRAARTQRPWSVFARSWPCPGVVQGHGGSRGCSMCRLAKALQAKWGKKRVCRGTGGARLRPAPIEAGLCAAPRRERAWVGGSRTSEGDGAVKATTTGGDETKEGKALAGIITKMGGDCPAPCAHEERPAAAPWQRCPNPATS